MSLQLGRFIKRNGGLTLAEVALAAAVLGIVIIGLVRVSAGVAKSLTQSKLKDQAVVYAKSELENYVRLSRVAGRETPSSTRLIPSGYDELLVAAPEATLVYPAALSSLTDGGPTAGGDRERLVLKRTVAVARRQANGSVAAGPITPGEYKVVSVTLADAQQPARFSPVTLETKIARPDELGLDARHVQDAATLAGQVVDSEDPVVPVPEARVVMSPDERSASATPDGWFTIGRLKTGAGVNYTMNVSARDYWPADFDVTDLARGLNRRTFPLSRIKKARVEVTVLHHYTGDALEGAFVEIDHPNPLPAGNSARNKTWYQAATDSAGKVYFEIPIPSIGGNVYPPPSSPVPPPGSPSPGYAVRLIHKEGFIDENTPGGVFVDIPLTLNVHRTEAPPPIRMYPVNTGHLVVKVVDPAGVGVEMARVAVLDSDDGLEVASERSDRFGFASITVPLNTIADKTRDFRNVKVYVQRMSYKAKTSVAVRVERGRTTRLDGPAASPNPAVQLEPHALVMQAQQGPDPSRRLAVTLGSPTSTPIEYRVYYDGHQGRLIAIDDIDTPEELPGVDLSTLRREWNWPAASLGYASPPDSRTSDTAYFYGTGEGDDSLSCTANFSFTSADAEYGPSGRTYPLSTTGASYVRVVRPLPTSGGGGPSVVSISGRDLIFPHLSYDYTASLAPGVPGTTYAWTIASGLGTLSAASGSRVFLTGLGPAGSVIDLEVVATLPTGVSLPPVRKTITVINNLRISLDVPSRRPVGVDSYRIPSWDDERVRATVMGGAGPYGDITWELASSPAGPALGHTPRAFLSRNTSPITSPHTQFTGRSPGIIWVRARVRDSVGDTATATIQVEVMPRGLSRR